MPTASKRNSFAAQWTILSLALIVLGAATATHLYTERRGIASQEQERLLAQARVVQKNLEASLAAVDAVLVDLRDSPTPHAAARDGGADMRTLIHAMPGVRTLLVLDDKGTVTASSRPELMGRNFAEREYFAAPRRHPDPETLFVSAPFRTSLGVYGVCLTRVILGPRGEFAGIAVATLDPDYFRPLLASVLYAPDMRTGIAHGDGVLFIIVPEREGQVGKNLLESGSFFTRHRDSGKLETVMIGTTFTAGDERMLAQRSVSLPRQDKPLVVAAGRDLDAIFAPWRKNVGTQSALFLAISLLAAGTLYAHQRRYAELLRKEADAAVALSDSERFMRVLTDNIPGMVGYWTAELNCRFANQAFLEWFGKTPDQMRGIRMEDLMDAELFHRNEPFVRAALRGERQHFERTQVKADGSIGHAWVQYIPDLQGDQVEGFYVLVTDITELKRAQVALAESEWKLKTIIEAEPECVKVLAPDGTLMQMNRAGLDMLEADTESQVLGQKVVDFVAPEYREAFIEFGASVFAGAMASMEFEITGLKGGRRWVDSRAVPMRDVDGRITGVLAVTRDITARKNAERELEKLAQTDFLTGLANRRHFLALAEQELARAQRYGGPLSVFMIDVDHFKNVNDTHGHQIGDLALQRLGAVCRQTLRDIDIVGRLGGEEFGVVLPHTDQADALEAAERLRHAVDGVAVPLERGLPLRVTISIGVATLCDPATNIDTLLSHADEALYRAKNAGRNRIACHPIVRPLSMPPDATEK